MSLELKTGEFPRTITISGFDAGTVPVWSVTSGDAQPQVSQDGATATIPAPATIPGTSVLSIAFQRSGTAQTDTLTLDAVAAAGGGGGLSFNAQ